MCFKRTLFEHVQAEGWHLCLDTRTDQVHPPSYDASVTVSDCSESFSGTSTASIKDAKQIAARSALVVLPANNGAVDCAVSLLNRWAQTNRRTLSWASVSVPEQFVVTSTVMLSGRPIAREQGSSKKNAENAAASSAIQTLAPEPDNAFADEIAQVVLQQANLLLSPQLREVLSVSVLAGFVQTSPATSPICVSLGVGTAHNPEAEVSRPSMRLMDCHAEVLARRGLLLYFHQQLKLAQQGASSIFTPAASGSSVANAFALRERVEFHLYISELPCGDASVCCPASHRCNVRTRPCISVPSLNGTGPPLPRDAEHAHWPSFKHKTQGHVRAKLDYGESLTPVVASGLDAEPRIRKVSCSDKLMRWNALGLQGAMLSHLISRPVFMSTVVVHSDHYWHGDMARALCCRLMGGQLPVHHPTLLRSGFRHLEFMPTAPPSSNKHAAARLAASWVRGASKLELIANAKQGLLRRQRGSLATTLTSAISQLHDYAAEQFLAPPVFTFVDVILTLQNCNSTCSGSVDMFEHIRAGCRTAQGFHCTVRIEDVTAVGTGISKQNAKARAAVMALDELLPGVCRLESLLSQRRLYMSFHDLSGGSTYAAAKEGSAMYAATKALLIAHLRANGQTWPQRGNVICNQDTIDCSLLQFDNREESFRLVE